MNLGNRGKEEGGTAWVGSGLASGLSSLDSEPQAVQGVLCEGDSRQSRLLGLVRYRLEHGSQEHA